MSSLWVMSEWSVILHSTEIKGAFLWEDPDQDFWSVTFLLEQILFQISDLSNPMWTRLIVSLTWVICKRSSDQWSGAFLCVKEPKLIIVRDSFGLELHMYDRARSPYVLHIWDPLPRSVVSICVVVSGLLKFKPVSAYCWVKVIRTSTKCMWNTNIWMGGDKPCSGFTTKLPYNSTEYSCM